MKQGNHRTLEKAAATQFNTFIILAGMVAGRWYSLIQARTKIICNESIQVYRYSLIYAERKWKREKKIWGRRKNIRKRSDVLSVSSTSLDMYSCSQIKNISSWYLAGKSLSYFIKKCFGTLFIYLKEIGDEKLASFYSVVAASACKIRNSHYQFELVSILIEF